MSEGTQVDSAAEAAPLARSRSALLPRLVLAAAGLLFLSILVVKVSPFFFWADNITEAGRLMDRALVWPDPRQPDSLPQIRDVQASEEALRHLEAAMRRRPTHTHARRMAGQIYAARAEWARASELWEHARVLSPKNPLLAWESSLIYEQMARAVEEAPAELLVAELAGSELDAPGELVETPLCTEGQAESCYVGETTFAMGYAGFGGSPVVTATTLFLHPPAQLSYMMEIPPERPALNFLMGLDPEARGLGSDGATYQIWAEAGGAEPMLVYERTVDGGEAAQGWVPGWADLSAWAGQEVTLRFATTPGPSGDASGDWYGWGDVALTSVEAATYASFAPQARMVAAWRAAGMDAAAFEKRATYDRGQDRAEEAERWSARAALIAQTAP